MRSRNTRGVALAVCLIVSLLAPHARAFAQTKAAEASLKVTVFDATGALVHDARVRVRTRKFDKDTATNRQGEAAFSRLAPGEYELTVEAAGFEPHAQAGLALAAGANSAQVRLAVASIQEEVAVSRDEQEKRTDPRNDNFSNVLTAEQIAQLPDDPEELEQAINALAGPGQTIRVNGFRGGRLPPKSHIKEIRFRMNPYAAENHETGFGFVDVTTKPGLNSWHGTLNFGFRDEALNARPVFSARRNPEQGRRVGLTFDGPLWPGRTSFFFSADANAGFDTKPIIAALPDRIFYETVARPARTLNVQARAEHSLSKLQTLRAEYQRNASRNDNLGIGDNDLPERGYTLDQAEQIFRLAETGTLCKRFFNELRLQARTQRLDYSPSTDAPTLIVNNSFARGGAQVKGSREVTEFELSENLDIPFERHSMRAGLLFEGGTYRSDESRNYLGTFTFASLADFAAERPSVYTLRSGDPSISYNNIQFGWYWQDDWRVRKDLTLSYGVRHEVQTHLSDRSNFAPRFGFAWSPLKSGKVTLRGGAGLFYDWFAAGTFEQTVRVDGVRQRDTVVREPGYPDPLSGGVVALPPSRIQRDPELRMPYVAQVSVGMETQLAKRFRLFTDYQFQRGTNLLRGRNLNAPVPGAGRPDPSVGNLTQIESTGGSTLHRVMVHFSPAMLMIGRGWFWNIAYRWSHQTSDTDGPFSLPADNFDLRQERGPAAQDVRHFFSAMINRQIVRNLNLLVIASGNSARPYNITTGRDDNFDTVFNDRPAGVGRNSARGDSRFEVTTRLAYGFDFGGQSAAAAAAGAGGPVPRAIRIGPGGVDGLPSAGAQKYRLELFVSASNLLNTANLAGYSGVVASPFFGQAASAMPGRRIETGFRFSL